MKLDLDYVRKVSDNLHQLYRESGGYYTEEHVYSVQFSPASGVARCLISWPYFRNLTANEADGPCELSKVQGYLHMTARVQGIEMVCCVSKAEVVDMLKESCGNNYEDYEVHEDEDILALFITWQNLTGWNVEVTE